MTRTIGVIIFVLVVIFAGMVVFPKLSPYFLSRLTAPIAPTSTITPVITEVKITDSANNTKPSEVPTNTPVPTKVLNKIPTPAAFIPDVVIWSVSRPLTWDDFKASPGASNNNEAAMSAVGLYGTFGRSASCSGSGPVTCTARPTSLTIRAQFHTVESWVSPDSKTADVLDHEQLHFDIAEVYARKLKEEMTKSFLNTPVTETGGSSIEASRKAVEKLQVQFDQIFDRIEDEYIQIQAQYDLEAGHGVDIGKQSEWNSKIRGML